MEGQRETARAYYTETLRRHGANARGVDWSSAASQYLRFAQLLKGCDFSQPFSINDFGCGYGALLEYFEFRGVATPIRYAGIDISAPMVEAAKAKWRHKAQAEFAVGAECREAADYSIASGVFNVKLEWPVEAWEDYVRSILANLRAKSRIAVGVNFMLKRDAPADERLYRTDPDRWIRFFRDELNCPAELVSDYGLPEFTLLARADR